MFLYCLKIKILFIILLIIDCIIYYNFTRLHRSCEIILAATYIHIYSHIIGEVYLNVQKSRHIILLLIQTILPPKNLKI